jgi:hypothetical protein
MLIYTNFARDLYVRFFLEDGKPVAVQADLPAESDHVNAHVDLFEPIVYNGQFLYSVVGWAYSTADPYMQPDDYERQVVLISDEINYFFPITTYPRPDIQEGFESLGMQLTSSGFRALIAPEIVTPGIYRTGVVFYDRNRRTAYYALASKSLIRTPNRFEIVDLATVP